MSAEFANAMAVVMNLPDGISGEELRARGPEAEQAATLICGESCSRACCCFAPNNAIAPGQRRRLGDMA